MEWQMSDLSAPSQLYADASAALGIAKRDGAGKLRHINVKSLWLQEKKLRSELTFNKIAGENNPADGLTKHVRQELAQKYASSTGIGLSQDRARESLRVSDGGA